MLFNASRQRRIRPDEKNRFHRLQRGSALFKRRLLPRLVCLAGPIRPQPVVFSVLRNAVAVRSIQERGATASSRPTHPKRSLGSRPVGLQRGSWRRGPWGRSSGWRMSNVRRVRPAMLTGRQTPGDGSTNGESGKGLSRRGHRLGHPAAAGAECDVRSSSNVSLLHQPRPARFLSRLSARFAAAKHRAVA